MAGKLQFQFDFGAGKPKRRESLRQRLLLLGDFSGHRPDKPALSTRTPWPVDIDRFDSLLERLGPQLRLGQEGAAVSFAALDDFHPDALYQRLPVFASLRNLRGRLENPASYAAAAAELKRGQTGPAPGPVPDADLFSQLLGGPVSPPGQTAAQQRQDIAQSLIQRLVEPHLDKRVDIGEQRQLIAAVDDAIIQAMREVLHEPGFQALEAVWRGSHWLADRIEDSEDIQIYALDLSLGELAEDLAAAQGHVEQTATYRLLTDSSLAVAGGEPWSLVVGHYRFGDDADSLGLLEFLGVVSACCGGVFIAGASSKLLGCANLAATPDVSDWPTADAGLAQAWHELRRRPVARHIGLALPRFMLRWPYGKKSAPIERFPFEEMPPRPPHEAYLWGNPALPCAERIIRAWREGEAGQEVPSLPYHIYDDGSGQAVKPCAEAYLNEKTAHALIDRGLMPVLSVRNQNHALVPRLQSIAEPATGIV